jgi:hypothetical protein
LSSEKRHFTPRATVTSLGEWCTSVALGILPPHLARADVPAAIRATAPVRHRAHFRRTSGPPHVSE